MQHGGGATAEEPPAVPDVPRSSTAAPTPIRRATAGNDRPVPVPVAIRADDPLAYAGAVHLLEGETGFDVLGPLDAMSSSDRAVVTILIAGRLDDDTVAELRRLTREADREVVLVVELLREAELMLVLECGVRGILRRQQLTGPELARTVRAAARHESRLPPDLLGQLMAHVGRTERARVHGHLPAAAPIGISAREVEILRLLAEGLDTREVGEKLAYSERTIKNRLHGLTMRLQLRNRTHAVAYALREGYL